MKPQDISDKLNKHERYNKKLDRKERKIIIFAAVFSVVADFIIYKIFSGSFIDPKLRTWIYILAGWLIVSFIYYVIFNFAREIFRFAPSATPPKEIMEWLSVCADDEDFRVFYLNLLSSSDILEERKHDEAVEKYFHFRNKELKRIKDEKLLNDAIYGKSDSEGVKND